MNQFGLREKHSKMHAALLITDNVRIAIEDGQFSCGIFLDLSKAFDTVDHSILIRKLGHYGICGIANDWFTSYVHNRRQYVTIGSSKSDELVVTHGVPQGSVLGLLLLFLYYISLVEQFWKLETSEILGDSGPQLSKRDKKALEIWRQSIQVLDGHYQTLSDGHSVQIQ